MRRRSLLAASLMLAPLALAGCNLVSSEGAIQGPAGQTLLVYFTADSASLDASGMETVTLAANLAKEHPHAPITVFGFADPEGSTQFNRALSTARAEHVGDELRKLGVDGGRILVRGRGPVAAIDMAQQSRRVEIRIGGPR